MPGTKDEPEEGSGSDSDSGKTKGRDRKSKKPMTDYEKKRQKIEETKKSLPVFPFREQLLEAISEHQVKI
jgi:HrpA-like RNA helicase